MNLSAKFFLLLSFAAFTCSTPSYADKSAAAKCGWFWGSGTADGKLFISVYPNFGDSQGFYTCLKNDEGNFTCSDNASRTLPATINVGWISTEVSIEGEICPETK